METLAGMKSAADSADWVLVLSQLPDNDDRLIAGRFAWIGAVLGGGLRDHPYGRWEKAGNTILAKAGVDGGTVGRIRVRINKDKTAKVDDVVFFPVDSTLPEDPAMARLVGKSGE
jgi:2',3'-cyclic-nucleotide 2'-phosphodiesterase (5'-nucleotidase family)